MRLHLKANSFSYEWVATKSRFDAEAKGNSVMEYCFGYFHFTKVKNVHFFPDFARACYELQNSAVNQTDATKYVKRAILQCRRRKLGETINLLDKKEI